LLQAGWSGVQTLVGAKFSSLIQTGPEAQPDSCTMSASLFSAGKVARAWHFPLLSSQLLVLRLKKVYSYTCILLPVLSWHVIGKRLP